jgi:tetratricopeptide (TPR) repeat protein
LGAALAKQGNSQAAIDSYHQALKIKPDDAEAHDNLGFALAKTGSPDEALKELQTALQLKADLPEVNKMPLHRRSKTNPVLKSHHPRFEASTFRNHRYRQMHHNARTPSVQRIFFPSWRVRPR